MQLDADGDVQPFYHTSGAVAAAVPADTNESASSHAQIAAKNSTDQEES